MGVRHAIRQKIQRNPIDAQGTKRAPSKTTVILKIHFEVFFQDSPNKLLILLEDGLYGLCKGLCIMPRRSIIPRFTPAVEG